MRVGIGWTLAAVAIVACGGSGDGDDADGGSARDATRTDAPGIDAPGIDAARPDTGVPPGGDGPIRDVAAGRHHTCALMQTGALACWGQGAYRALGGDYNFQGTPRLVEAIDDALDIEAGTRFGCAIRPGGALWCWGENADAQIGANATIPCGDCTPIPECADSICVPAPQAMVGLESGIVDLALGGTHGCALRDDGQVLCWGSNAAGQVGHSDLAQDLLAPHVVPGVAGAHQITAGLDHTCARIGTPGTVMCWGQNDRAQVGNGEVSDAVPVPATVAGIGDAIDLIAGGSHTCALRAGGSVVCWGYNYLGALGNGSTRPTRATAIEEVVGLTDAVQLTAGQYFTCALRSTGTIVCWGDNRHGQLGDGTSEGDSCVDRPCRPHPVEVRVVSGAVRVEAGELHACAASGDTVLWCWGYNLGGQLGTGGVDDGPTPVPIEVAGLPM